jgi:hypothetical protein
MSGAREVPVPPPRPAFEFRSLARAAAPRRPRVMTWSVGLWLAAVTVTVATAALALLNFDQLYGRLLADVALEFPDETPATRERVVAATLLILIGSGLLIGLLQAAFALAMGSRRRWARLALVPLWLLGAIHGLAMFSTVPVPVLLGLLVAAGLSAIAAVAMFLPASNAWLAGTAGRHRVGRAS